MKTLTVKQIFNIVGNPFCLDPTMSYPVIEGSTANFLTYYNTNRENLDRMFVHDFGERLVDFEASSDADIEDEWYDEIKAIEQVYIENWARLWYALSEPYNPLYNVDGVETTVYGEHVTDKELGQRQRTDGQRTDTSTAFTMAYDAATEKETGKQEDVIGQQITTDASVKDTDTSKTHTDTVTRQGNIGVTKSTELLRDEVRLRSEFAFFKTVFQTMIEEIGGYYAGSII